MTCISNVDVKIYQQFKVYKLLKRKYFKKA